MPPRDALVVAKLAGIPADASAEEREALLAQWYQGFYQRNQKSGPNPIAYAERMRALSGAEAQGLSPMATNAAVSGTAKMLMIPIKFAGTDDLAACDSVSNAFVNTATVTGPLNGEIPDPAGGDNYTIWTHDFSVQWYEDLVFGDGVGVIRTDLNSGSGIDMTGVSAARSQEWSS